MFNDKYGLSKAVLEGKKTQTRRILGWNVYKNPLTIFCQGKLCVNEVNHQEETSKYAVGEVLAVAQPLKDLGYNPNDRANGAVWGLDHTPAWKNKMFVCASQCKDYIRITNIRLERLQDITDEDCLAEGIRRWEDEEEYSTSSSVRKSIEDLKAAGYEAYAIPGRWDCYTSPRKAFADLIDKVSGKGTWEQNPWVFVYDFELIK